jgi:antifreeze-like protein
MAPRKRTVGSCKTYTGASRETIVGSNKDVISSHCIVVGSNNVIYGDFNTITGSNNNVYGNNNVLTGSNNDVEGDDNTLVGTNNTAEGSNNVLEGSNSTNISKVSRLAPSISKKKTRKNKARSSSQVVRMRSNSDKIIVAQVAHDVSQGISITQHCSGVSGSVTQSFSVGSSRTPTITRSFHFHSSL